MSPQSLAMTELSPEELVGEIVMKMMWITMKKKLQSSEE